MGKSAKVKLRPTLKQKQVMKLQKQNAAAESEIPVVTRKHKICSNKPVSVVEQQKMERRKRILEGRVDYVDLMSGKKTGHKPLVLLD